MHVYPVCVCSPTPSSSAGSSPRRSKRVRRAPEPRSAGVRRPGIADAALPVRGAESTQEVAPELTDEEDSDDDADDHQGIDVAAGLGVLDPTATRAVVQRTAPVICPSSSSRMALRQRPHPEAARLGRVPPFTVRSFLHLVPELLLLVVCIRFYPYPSWLQQAQQLFGPEYAAQRAAVGVGFRVAAGRTGLELLHVDPPMYPHAVLFRAVALSIV